MLFYHRQGSRRSQTLLFLHGFMGRGSDWEPLIQLLAREFDCIAADLPGHGRSTLLPTAMYSIGGAAETLLALLDAANVEACSVVGYSMGARLALYFGLQEPGRVQNLVLISGSPGLRTREARRARRELDERRARDIEENMEGFIENWQQQPVFDSLRCKPQLVRHRMASQRRNDPNELARSLRLMGTGSQPSLWEKLEQLEVPALAVTGALDRKYMEIAEHMARLTPIIRPAIIPDAGHAVHLEAPDAVLAAIRGFVTPEVRRGP